MTRKNKISTGYCDKDHNEIFVGDSLEYDPLEFDETIELKPAPHILKVKIYNGKLVLEDEKDKGLKYLNIDYMLNNTNCWRVKNDN